MTENQVKMPDSVTDYFHRGVTKHHLGQYSAAIAEYSNTV